MGATSTTEFNYTATEEKGDQDIQNYVVISKENAITTPPLHVQYGYDDEEKENKSLDDTTPRILMYYSPTENNKPDPVTLSEISKNINPTTNKPYITHIEICTLHLSQFDNDVYIHINDEAPTNSDFSQIKQEISVAQAAGIKVLFMLGGAEGKAGTAPTSESSWVNLFNDWNLFYPKLVSLCKEWNVDGIDLDCENKSIWQRGTSNLNNINKLITNLHNDMGDTFHIVLAPVAQAIYANLENGGLSGFNYKQLMQSNCGTYISWLNLQFYNGWGTLNSPNEYEECVTKQHYNSQQLVAGMINCSANSLTNNSIKSLSKAYQNNFGGVFVWQGNTQSVQKWSETMQSDIDEKSSKK